ncbi:MAG: glycosyltransferase family 2 protein [Verrucomicrobiota bacterium]
MKLSVLTPALNCENYLQRAIDSTLAQHHPNWEHIVVDGGSTDNTLDILADNEHITWVSESDEGQSDAMNKAFAMSTGEIILYLNADDMVAPGTFEYVLEYFESQPQCQFLVGDLLKAMDDKHYLDTPSISLDEIIKYWPCRFPLNPVSYYYKRNVQQRIGRFPVSNHFTMDYWFLLRAYKFFKIDKSDRVFGTYFFDGTNKSSDAERAQFSLRSVQQDFLKEFS